jgi:hypothetical protein
MNVLKFELSWLLRDSFLDMVKNIWASVSVGSSPLERWQAKIRQVSEREIGLHLFLN